MSESEDNICMEVKPTVSILLPLCVELENDVFLSILRNFIWRSGTDEYEYNLDALKSGMTIDMLCIKSKDVLVNWKQLTSKSQRYRQLQLLGFWTTRNYPELGRKLVGATWKAIRGQSIEVIGNQAMSSDEVDAIIMQKMKLRLIELYVCPNTLTKLKHFVETPINIGKCNEIRISPKMKSFDIESDHVEKCWKALKLGKFSMIEQQIDLDQPEQGIISIRTEEMERRNSCRNDSQLMPVAKRPYLNSTDCTRTKELGIISRNDCHLVPLVKRLRLDATTRTEANERSYSSEIYDENLRNENKTLKEQIKGNASLINALQQGIDATTKLNRMIELSSKNQIDDLSKSLSESDRVNVEMSEKITKLEAEINAWKNSVASQEDELIETENSKAKTPENKNESECIDSNYNLSLQKQIDKMTKKNLQLERDLASMKLLSKTKIRDLSKSLSESERVNVEMSEKITKLESEVNEWKHSVASKEDELVEAREAQKTLDALKVYANDMVTDLQNQIQNFEINLADAQKTNLELTSINDKLEMELKRWNSNASTQNESVINSVTENSKAKTPENENESEEFETDDLIVRLCRDKLLKLQFGWNKFGTTKNCKSYPEFAFPPDPDGHRRALKITFDGYVENTKNLFEIKENIPDDKKNSREVVALTNFNKKFKTFFV